MHTSLYLWFFCDIIMASSSKFSHHFLLLAVFLILIFQSCEKTDTGKLLLCQGLKGEWFFAKEGDDTWLPATVPGTVHLDLFHNHRIEDPFFENNEQNQAWIENENWAYRLDFAVDEELLKRDHLILKFNGLDTYAEVYLNGQKILHADNMFRSWEAEVKSLLKPQANSLRIVFTSPILKNQEIVHSYPFHLPSGNEAEEIPTKVSPFTRKAAYHFGWDWAPRFVGCGIWRPIELIAWSEARIVNANTSTLSIENGRAAMITRVEMEVSEAGVYDLILDEEVIQKNLVEGTNTVEHRFSIEQAELWWCNGIGDPFLYKQNIRLSKDGTILGSRKLTYGVRTIERINEADSIGTSFYFKLNGKAVFMQGANYIPQDVFLPRVKEEQYVKLIADVKAANMNMLRVWGGGIYENDLFYELCDQNGILVWQDFMFAGSMYPDTRSFRDNVKEEVKENIQRLAGHPCIALWCGNNEIEVAWKNWDWQTRYGYAPEDSARLWENYKYIFQQLIPEQLARYAPEAQYTHTSPLSNWGKAENFKHSSMHYWGVWHGKEKFEAFEKNVGRFMVEYGFQSFPSIASLRKVMNDSCLSLSSSVMKNRQKSYIGNGLISQHIQHYYPPPSSFEEFIDLSQKTQAKALQMAVRAHKESQPHCMGTLLWQLNDCWPGPSWSIIDYYGEHKAAYEVVKDEFGK